MKAVRVHERRGLGAPGPLANSACPLQRGTPAELGAEQGLAPTATLPSPARRTLITSGNCFILFPQGP